MSKTTFHRRVLDQNDVAGTSSVNEMGKQHKATCSCTWPQPSPATPLMRTPESLLIPHKIQQTASQQNVSLPLAQIVLNGEFQTLRDVAHLEKAAGRERFLDPD